MNNLSLVGAIISLFGSFFLFIGALGVLRMPDVYNRMQAGTKAATLGSLLFLAGIAVSQPLWTGKILLLIVFIVFTNPVSSHALARAAHAVGTRLSQRTVKDCLAIDESEEGGC